MFQHRHPSTVSPRHPSARGHRPQGPSLLWAPPPRGSLCAAGLGPHTSVQQVSNRNRPRELQLNRVQGRLWWEVRESGLGAEQHPSPGAPSPESTEVQPRPQLPVPSRGCCLVYPAGSEAGGRLARCWDQFQWSGCCWLRSALRAAWRQAGEQRAGFDSLCHHLQTHRRQGSSRQSQ